MCRSALSRTLLGLFITSVPAIGFAQSVTVKPGDNLWNLAHAYDTDVATLMELNGLTTNNLSIGQTLVLPGGTEPRPVPTTVTVAPGDTLYEIAVANSVSVDDLIAFNSLDGTLIYPGQELALSGDSVVTNPLVVTVASGDSLWSIARRYDSTIDEIAAANGIDKSSTLALGTELRIPGRYASNSVDVGGPAAQEIVVTAGDTLWQIAQKYDSNVATLMSANRLVNSELRVGQRLVIVPNDEVKATRAAEPSKIISSSASAPMIWPLVGQITSRFGYRQLRVSGSNFHTGLDIDGNTGDPILAAVSGTVKEAGWHGGYGNLVIVTNGNTDYYYGHASEILVSAGETVRVGQEIAKVGSTGNSTGPHLHFEIRVDGDMIDPLSVLESRASR